MLADLEVTAGWAWGKAIAHVARRRGARVMTEAETDVIGAQVAAECRLRDEAFVRSQTPDEGGDGELLLAAALAVEGRKR
jgi:hypothetical protein